MILNMMQTLIIIGVMALGTIITRFLPFFLFPDHRQTPHYVLYLGRVLPYAVIGLLVVYCLKEVDISIAPFGTPEAISMVCIGILHFWKSNTLLSIGVGTAVYMLLIQFVFI
jgi:branched-subunit amino acid transport protein AzlD